MKLQAAISSLGLCVIFGAGPLLAANPVEGMGDTIDPARSGAPGHGDV